MKGLNLKFKGKIIATICSMLLLLAVAILATVYYSVNDMVEENVNQQLQSAANTGSRLLDERYPGDWRIDGGNLLKGTKLLNDDTELVDAIKSDTDAISTIFLNDTRIATNVMVDGKRATGTQMSEQVADVVLKQGKTYDGEATILGSLHQTKYIPIKDASGKVIGSFFVGVEKSSMVAQVNSIILNIAVFSMVAIVIGIVLSVLLVRTIYKILPSKLLDR